MINIEKLTEEIDNIFVDAIDVHDTIWYSGTETLYEAIYAVIEDSLIVDAYEHIKLLQSIIDADKTLEYGYGIAATNNAGHPPPVGAKWLTPAEICKEALEELKG